MQYQLDIDPKLFKRQRLALMQAISDSPHPLRTELLQGLEGLIDEIADQLADNTGELRHLIDH